ncbi:MAG: RHS repeat-associated core domain-containing protein [Gammaproteobacteria bacterium]
MKIRNSVCVFFCLWVVFLGTAWGSSSTKITYTYDESNKRIAQDIENQGKTLFIYDVQDRLIAEMDAAGNTLVEYIYLNGRQIAMANKTGQPDEALYLTHTDHLGTPEVMTDTVGNEVWRREQTPFGETVKIEGSITQNMRFLGQRYHEETGLHYNLNRDYNPSIGQYVQSDPIGMAGGINTFVYANNNPVMYSDPEGLNPLLLLYGAYKLGSFAYDLYDTYQTATDPCSSSWDMAMAIGGTGADLLNPLGAGLSRAVKVGKVAKGARKPGSAGINRTGKDFTPKTKQQLDADNAARNSGVNKCENCGVQTVPGQRAQRGVTPPGNERQRDHIIPKSKGGDGTFENGQILCRSCNLNKRDN